MWQWLTPGHTGLTLTDVLRLPPQEVDGYPALRDLYYDVAARYRDRLWGVIELDLGGPGGMTATRAMIERDTGINPIPRLSSPHRVAYRDQVRRARHGRTSRLSTGLRPHLAAERCRGQRLLRCGGPHADDPPTLTQPFGYRGEGLNGLHRVKLVGNVFLERTRVDQRVAQAASMDVPSQMSPATGR